MSSSETVLIYIQLLGEGSPAARGTQAVPMGDGRYRVLPTPDYDPEDEIWEFPPGSIVRCEKTLSARGTEILLAIESAA